MYLIVNTTRQKIQTFCINFFIGPHINVLVNTLNKAIFY